MQERLLFNFRASRSLQLSTPKIPHILLLFSTNLVKIMVKELEDMSVQLANREKYRGEKNGVKGFYD